MYHLLNIGIDYRGTQSRLAGCIADAVSWHGLLSARCDTALQLIEQNATKSRIVTAIKGMADLCKIGSDNTGIITFSGHGTFRRAADGNESDGNDEAICCYDFTQGGLLWDNEIGSILAGSQCLFITDCCHSHTLTRNVIMPGDPVPRYIPFADICEGLLPCEVTKLCEGADSCRAAARSVRDASGAIPGVIHLAGCKDSEFSYDANFGGQPNGAMTYFAVQAYRQLPVGATYQQWIDVIKTKLPTRSYPQNPQLTATAEDLRRVIVGKELPAQPPVIPPPTATGQVLRGIFEDGRKFKLEISP